MGYHHNGHPHVQRIPGVRVFATPVPVADIADWRAVPIFDGQAIALAWSCPVKRDAILLPHLLHGLTPSDNRPWGATYPGDRPTPFQR